MSFSGFIVQLLNGLASASSLFLVAAGLSLIFGVTRIVNFAHGSFFMVGIYVAYTLVDRLGTHAPVPVEVVAFGLDVVRPALEVFASEVRPRLSPAGDPFITDGGNRILDCRFAGPIADPARLEDRIGRIVGVVESGLFIGRADPVFVADGQGVHRLDRVPAAAPSR